MFVGSFLYEIYKFDLIQIKIDEQKEISW